VIKRCVFATETFDNAIVKLTFLCLILQIHEVISVLKRLEFKTGEIVMRQGVPGDTFYLVRIPALYFVPVTGVNLCECRLFRCISAIFIGGGWRV